MAPPGHVPLQVRLGTGTVQATGTLKHKWAGQLSPRGFVADGPTCILPVWEAGALGG